MSRTHRDDLDWLIGANQFGQHHFLSISAHHTTIGGHVDQQFIHQHSVEVHDTVAAQDGEQHPRKLTEEVLDTEAVLR